jgi:thiamine biosynthesis lipoprotein
MIRVGRRGEVVVRHGSSVIDRTANVLRVSREFAERSSALEAIVTQRRMGCSCDAVVHLISMRDGDLEEYVFRHHPMLGTVVEVRVVAGSEAGARRVSDAAITEIARLESVFSAYDTASELSRWKRGDLANPSDEFNAVMAAALEWQRRSDGTFNPLTGAVSSMWQRAVARGAPPSASELRDVVDSIREPRFEMRDGRPVRLGDCAELNLNAIAKGFVVDAAVGAVAAAFDPAVILVSAGGDLAQRGDRPSTVAIENPMRPYDNEPPIALVELHNGGLATSGGSRRGFRIGDHFYSHVIDPRSGLPVEHHSSISVLASDAMTADVLATVAGMLPPPDAVRYVDGLTDTGCLIVDADGRQFADSTWRQAQITGA